MKRIMLLVIITNMAIFCFPQSNNYADGNGTIIETKTEGNARWIIRKHIQRLQIGDLAIGNDLNIYNHPTLEKIEIIGDLELDDFINITQVAEVALGNDNYVWLKINTDNNTSGWIYLGEYNSTSLQSRIPYYNNRWEIIEYIKIRNKIWTIRKLIPQKVSVWETINLYDKPGFIDTNIISQIIPIRNDGWTFFLETTAATEETETIDRRTDRWLKTNYNGIEGWIFGGYVDVERGGPKYYIPEWIISFHLTWY